MYFISVTSYSGNNWASAALRTLQHASVRTGLSALAHAAGQPQRHHRELRRQEPVHKRARARLFQLPLAISVAKDIIELRTLEVSPRRKIKNKHMQRGSSFKAQLLIGEAEQHPALGAFY
eukprot:3806153-Pleurochrysis_carterae.AAC.1